MNGGRGEHCSILSQEGRCSRSQVCNFSVCPHLPLTFPFPDNVFRPTGWHGQSRSLRQGAHLMV
jgi:hypothetical protein